MTGMGLGEGPPLPKRCVTAREVAPEQQRPQMTGDQLTNLYWQLNIDAGFEKTYSEALAETINHNSEVLQAQIEQQKTIVD